ncbi:MAG: hypothetical protein LBU58_08235 [Clostridiales bacterium]|jgi:hypothetical protein|nr:hypothetical protein [Clostridiales bacterium]
MKSGGGELTSAKAEEIISKQKPIDHAIVKRAKNALARKGIVLDQSGG